MDIEDQIEQDVVCAFMAAGANLDDRDTCEEISNSVHDECFCFYSREQARAKGVRVDRRIHSFRSVSALSMTAVMHPCSSAAIAFFASPP